jgi:hypothetical protein
MAEDCVLAQRRSIKHLPKPNEWLPLGITVGIDIDVILWFCGDVAWIEVVNRYASCKRKTVKFSELVPVIDLCEGFLDDDIGIPTTISSSVIKLL